MVSGFWGGFRVVSGFWGGFRVVSGFWGGFRVVSGFWGGFRVVLGWNGIEVWFLADFLRMLEAVLWEKFFLFV